MIAIKLVYYAAPHAKWGQTLGKRAMRIRVVRAGDGHAIGYGRAAWRVIFEQAFLIIVNLIASAFALLALFGYVNYAWILWDPRRQPLHDKAAQTVVVTAWPGSPNPYRSR